MKSMASLFAFLLKWVVIAALSSAAVVVACQYVPPKQAEWFVCMGRQARVDQVADSVFVRVDGWVEQTRELYASRDDDEPGAEPAGTAEKPTTTPGTVAVPPATVPTNGVSWAVTCRANTKAYSLDGKFLRHLNPGVLAEIVAVKDTRAGKMAVCDVHMPDRVAKGVLIARADLDPIPGRHETIEGQTRSLAQQRGRLLAQINLIQAQLRSGLRPDNPYYEEYIAARDAYKAFNDKIKPLRDAHDKATGENRARLADRLREVNADGIRLGIDYKKSKGNYDSWNRSHPARPDSNPRVVAMREELDALDVRLETALRQPKQ